MHDLVANCVREELACYEHLGACPPEIFRYCRISEITLYSASVTLEGGKDLQHNCN